MREYLKGFLLECEYPSAATQELMFAYDKIAANSKDDFEKLISEYEKSYDIDYIAAIEKMNGISLASSVHEYTGALLLFLCYTRGLRGYYEERGISYEIFKNTVLDLKYKMDECLCVKGIAGTFVAKWFAGFFRLERFALGRLQFEIVEFGCEYDSDEISLTPDSRVINVHIPRTGGHLDRESVLSSYKLAADFYRQMLGEKIVFTCSSWLLFPKNKEMLRQNSNLLAFINDFNIYASGEYPDYKEVWRLFDTEFDGDASHLPANTSLRRAYIDLISRGEKTGWGKGVFLYKFS